MCEQYLLLRSAYVQRSLQCCPATKRYAHARRSSAAHGRARGMPCLCGDVTRCILLSLIAIECEDITMVDASACCTLVLLLLKDLIAGMPTPWFVYILQYVNTDIFNVRNDDGHHILEYAFPTTLWLSSYIIELFVDSGLISILDFDVLFVSNCVVYSHCVAQSLVATRNYVCYFVACINIIWCVRQSRL